MNLSMKQALEKAEFKAEHAEVTMKPSSEALLAGEDAVKCRNC